MQSLVWAEFRPCSVDCLVEVLVAFPRRSLVALVKLSLITLVGEQVVDTLPLSAQSTRAGHAWLAAGSNHPVVVMKGETVADPGFVKRGVPPFTNQHESELSCVHLWCVLC